MLRGLDTPIRAIRRQVFTEAAKLGLKANSETLLDDMEEIPYKIVNEDTEQYRESVYLSLIHILSRSSRSFPKRL